MTEDQERIENLELRIMQARMDVARLKQKMSHTRQLCIDFRMLQKHLRKSPANADGQKKHS